MEAADRVEKEKTQIFLKELRAKLEVKSKMAPLMDLLGEQIDAERRLKAEREMEREAAAAAEAVRAKYAEEFPSEWNESETDKAYRAMLRGIFPTLTEDKERSST